MSVTLEMTNGPDSWNRISEDEVRLLMRTGEEDPRPTVAEVAEAMSVTEEELRLRLAGIRSQRLSELEKEVLRLQDENQWLKHGLNERPALSGQIGPRHRERGRLGFGGFLVCMALIFVLYQVFMRTVAPPPAAVPGTAAPAPTTGTPAPDVPSASR